MRKIIFSFLTAVLLVAAAFAQSVGEIAERRAKAEQGSAFTQWILGNAYWNGKGVAQDKREAVRWYLKAAEQGFALAQSYLGLAYWNGEGVAQDKREAVRWYLKAAEQGFAWAQGGLGFAYWNGEGVAQDKREAVRWYLKAAEQGFALAQSYLGLAYWNGEGVAQDKREAVRWYRKAAEQGNAWAQFRLGFSYSHGEGVAQDKHEAVRWFRKAAEQGYVQAQIYLSEAYYFGAGIVQNKREAMRWARKAAEQGNDFAQFAVGTMYLSGEGVITDKREAYIWYSIAKANGSEDATGPLHEFNWRDYLTRSEIRSAQKEAARRLEAIESRMGEDESARDSFTAAPAPRGTNTAENVFENTWRSVVVVHNGDGQGSGVIIRPNIVATNCHVVDEDGGILVYKSDNRRTDTNTAFPATIRHFDEARDFCLLDVGGLWGVPVSVRPYDTLKIGENVYGLGAPRGLDLSISAGLISQLRTIGNDRYIQTDVAISPGSSGGGLFDSEGNLIGIMTAKIVDEDTEGIGFAIPADLVEGR